MFWPELTSKLRVWNRHRRTGGLWARVRARAVPLSMATLGGAFIFEWPLQCCVDPAFDMAFMGHELATWGCQAQCTCPAIRPLHAALVGTWALQSAHETQTARHKIRTRRLPSQVCLLWEKPPGRPKSPRILRSAVLRGIFPPAPSLCKGTSLSPTRLLKGQGISFLKRCAMTRVKRES